MLLVAALLARAEPACRLFNDTWNRPGPAADFFAVYHAGRQVLGGASPYDDHESPRFTPEFAPFRYAPGVAWTLGVAVAWAKPWLAYGFWVLVLEALLLLDLLLLPRVIADVRLRRRVALGWLLFTPLALEVYMGQFTFVAASLVFIAFVAGQGARPRPRLAAGAWAAAAALKLFPLALAPFLLARRRWLALATGAVVVGAALAPLLAAPADAELFVRLNFTEVDTGSFHTGNLGLPALVYRVLDAAGGVSDATWRVIAAALALILAGASAAVMLRRGTDERVAFALALALLPLVSKHAWEHHHVALLPAMTLLAAAWAGRQRHLAALAGLWIVLALPTPFLLLHEGPPVWDPGPDWSTAARLAYHAPKPLAALALWALACLDRPRVPA